MNIDPEILVNCPNNLNRMVWKKLSTKIKFHEIDDKFVIWVRKKSGDVKL